MRDSVTQFFSSVHRKHLKARGYKKVQRTFSREMPRHSHQIRSIYEQRHSPRLTLAA